MKLLEATNFFLTIRTRTAKKSTIKNYRSVITRFEKHFGKEYIRKKEIHRNSRIFPITYSAARIMVMKAGKLVNINLRPHDLRRHTATFASRSGTPLEIVSKIILRHSNLVS